MAGRRIQIKLALTWTLLLCSTWSASSEQRVNAQQRPACQSGYPTVRLVPGRCQPVPTWCRRLAGRGGSSWRQCRARCDGGQLEFGDETYPVAQPVRADAAGAKKALKSLFRLAVRGWRQRSLTIWQGRVYAWSRSGRAWRAVYLVGNRLVALPIGAKPPRYCSRGHRSISKNSLIKPHKAAAAEDKSLRLHGGGHRLSGVRASCHGNACTMRLSLRRLLRQVRRLSRRRRHGGAVMLRFVLAAAGARAKGGHKLGRLRFVGGEIALDRASRRTNRRDRRRGRRRDRRDDASPEDSASAYRRFLDRRRQKYWQRHGRKPDGDQSSARVHRERSKGRSQRQRDSMSKTPGHRTGENRRSAESSRKDSGADKLGSMFDLLGD